MTDNNAHNIGKNLGEFLEEALDEWRWQEKITKENIPEDMKNLSEEKRQSLLDSRLIICLSNILYTWQELKKEV